MIVFSVCKTESGPEMDKMCIFPFNYKGRTYTDCTTKDAHGTYWCATEVNSNGDYYGRWGNCGSTCVKGMDLNTNKIVEKMKK